MSTYLKQAGLQEHVKDERDFSLGALIKYPKLDELPSDYVLPTLEVKNQGDTDMCAAFSATTISEVQESVTLSPEFAFAKAKQIEGSTEGWGLSLRTIAKAMTRYGTIETHEAPFSLASHDREFLATWTNWPPELDTRARIHRKKTYWLITGPYDHFDNIRATLIAGRKKKQGVIIGVQFGWPLEQVIMDALPDGGFGHALPVIGFKTIAGVVYLKVQNSVGSKAGENGCHYLSRDIVNHFVEKYGAYTLLDLDREDAEYLLSNGITLADNWVVSAFKAILSLLHLR